MRVIDIDVTKPELQSVRAAQELLEQDYAIVFPSDTVYGLLMRYSAENAARLHDLRREERSKPFLLVVSEDFDWKSLTAEVSSEQADFAANLWPGPNTMVLPKSPALSYPEGVTIALRMPALTTNRAFHTLVQLCDFPLLAPSLNKAGEPTLADRATAAAVFPEIEYAFWDERFVPGQPSAVWNLCQSPPARLR